MKNVLLKYGPQPPDNPGNTQVGSETENRDTRLTLGTVWVVMKEGEPRMVRFENEANDARFFNLAVMHNYHPGLSLFNILFKQFHSPVQVAMKLGKSFHPKETELKLNTNLKKHYPMKTFEIKRILVPTDFSETGMLAIQHAAYMAKICKARLYLLHIVESFEYAYSEYEPEILVKDLDDVQAVATEKLEKIAANLETQYGIKTYPILNNGKPSSGITECVKDNSIDIIIMGTHGAKGFEEFIIGSNAQKVVSVSPCPVITVQANAKDIQFTNIVVPIDNSIHSRQKVNYAIEIASHYGARIHLLGLLDSNEEVTEADERKFKIKLDAVENVLKQTNIPYIRKFVKGHNIAVEAMKYSEDVNADLLVIMTDHESNLSKVLLGSLAKQIVNHSKIPVMSIRPLEGLWTTNDMGVSLV
jgi:nucleotide-binding universal stress UspA family protein